MDKWNFKQRSDNTPLVRKAKNHTLPPTWNETVSPKCKSPKIQLHLEM